MSTLPPELERLRVRPAPEPAAGGPTPETPAERREAAFGGLPLLLELLPRLVHPAMLPYLDACSIESVELGGLTLADVPFRAPGCRPVLLRFRRVAAGWRPEPFGGRSLDQPAFPGWWLVVPLPGESDYLAGAPYYDVGRALDRAAPDTPWGG